MNATLITCALLLGGWVPPPEDASIITLRVKYTGSQHGIPLDPVLALATQMARHRPAKHAGEATAAEPAQPSGHVGPQVANVSSSWLSPLHANLATTQAGLGGGKMPLPSVSAGTAGGASGSSRGSTASSAFGGTGTGNASATGASLVPRTAASSYTAPSIPSPGISSYAVPYANVPTAPTPTTIQGYLSQQPTTVNSYMQRAVPYATQMHLGGNSAGGVNSGRGATQGSPQFNPNTQNAPGFAPTQYFNNTGSYYGH